VLREAGMIAMRKEGLSSFCFIADPIGASADIFIHYSEIRTDGYKTLEEGDTVEFELSPSERGPKALNVVKI
jgi:CspA family cold shock protein